MIIERRFVPFGILIEKDPKAKKIYLNAFKKSNLPLEEQNRIIEYNKNNCIFDWEMGCGIPNPELIIKGFEKLDITDPFDNGFTYDDVYKLEIFQRDEDSVGYFLLNYYDERVKVVYHSFSPFEYMKVKYNSFVFTECYALEIKNEKNLVCYKLEESTKWKNLNLNESEKWLTELASLNINNWKRRYLCKSTYIYDGGDYEIEYKEKDKKVKKINVENDWPLNFNVFNELLNTLLTKKGSEIQ